MIKLYLKELMTGCKSVSKYILLRKRMSCLFCEHEEICSPNDFLLKKKRENQRVIQLQVTMCHSFSSPLVCAPGM